MSRSLKTAGVEVRSSSRTLTSTRNPRSTPGHPHSTRKSHISPSCGWIGCGDAPIGRSPESIEEFNSIFAHYKTKTRTFAPPHHGSERDWSDEILDGFGRWGKEAPICVFSANNLRWSHPSTKAILSANNIGSPTIVVTNDTRSRFTETIEMIIHFD